jgi:linoleoyl-CoA desaturase
MEAAVFPTTDEEGNLGHNWAVHQLMTTTNYAPNNRMLSWFVGGLNYQVEHHLFPNVCHIHYRRISKIVRETAEEYNFPYHTLPSFRSALRIHWNMLRSLGTGQPMPTIA